MSTQLEPRSIVVSLDTKSHHTPDRLLDAVRARVGAEVSTFFTELGVDQAPDVQLQLNGGSDGHPISMSADGTPLPVPKQILAEVAAYVDGRPEVDDDTSNVLGSLGADDADSRGEQGERLGELLALVCRTALSMRCEAHSSAGTLDVHINPVLLGQLLDDLPAEARFPFMRDGLFAELGIPLGQGHLVPDTSLRPAGFGFRIGGVRTQPRIGLPPDTILVNAPPDHLFGSCGVSAVETLNPATWAPAALTDRSHKDLVEVNGFTTWDTWDHLILCFAAEVRARAKTLMTHDVAAQMISEMGRAFPVLAEAAGAHIPIDTTCSVLRDLLDDRISIRNMRRIVELLLAFELRDDHDRTFDRVSFVRAGMADAIANKLSRGTGTVVVYLLDPKLEHGLGDGDAVASTSQQLLAAAQAEIALLPRTASCPAILTQAPIRTRVRDALRGEFPNIAVVTYDELPTTCNIQPIARLSPT